VAGSLASVPKLAADPVTSDKLQRLRDSYPVFRIESAEAVADGGSVRLAFRFTCRDRVFVPEVTLTGLDPAEAARVANPAAWRIVRALAIVEAASYWKAAVSPVIEVRIGDADPAELAWWESFWQPAMGEFYFRNGIDFTVPGFLQIRAAAGLPAGKAVVSSPKAGAARPLVMFSGGKDSLALTYALKDGGPVDFFLYNPTASQRTPAESLAEGGRVTEIRRVIVAGNSRSDDEPNVESYLGVSINHQWTKSAQYEAALQDYARMPQCLTARTAVRGLRIRQVC
jgi:hypothetical protein